MTPDIPANTRKKTLMNLPRITVITPSLNQARFLRESIECILNQGYPNLEYFIIDGGSTDGSLGIIREYESRIDWWVSEKDKGQSDALRKGFERATGELIGWLNADDVYFPGALEKIGHAYVAHPNASIYAGGIAIGAMHDGPIRKCIIPSPPWAWISKYGILDIGQQSSLYSTTIYRKTGGINVDLYIRMDGDLWFRLLKRHPHAVVIDEMIGFIRWHPETKSSRGYQRYVEERDQFFASVGLTGWRYHAILTYYKLRRLVSGSYFKSILATQRYKGMRMSEIWARELGKTQELK